MAATGIVGLGEMGFALATRLLSQGYTVIGYDPSPDRAAAAAAAGVALRADPAAVATDSDIVLVNVRTEDHLTAAWGGRDGMLSAAKGRIIVIMGTFNPATVESIAAEAQATGGVVVDAPHTGSQPAALSGELIVWLAGEPEAVELVRPVIAAVSAAAHVIGPRPGMAQAVKLINAMGLAINLTAVTEMQQVADTFGIDRDLVLRVIEGGSGSNWVSSSMSWVEPFLTEHHIRNLHKDLVLAMTDVTRAGYDMPVAAAAMYSIRSTWPRHRA